MSVVQFREANPQDDAIIADHFYQLWCDNGVTSEMFRPDWQETALQFIENVRQYYQYKAFVVEVEGQVVGSVGCQLFTGLYPNVLANRQYGYIWSVYVDSAHRRQGFATRLTEMAIAHLKSIGCTLAVLHASPSGRPVYEQIGFINSNEMRLDLS